MVRIGIGIMASGKGSRMGQNKLLVHIGGKPMAEHMVEKIAVVRDEALEVEVHTLIVTPYEEVKNFAIKQKIEIRDNFNSHKGKSESVKIIVDRFKDMDGIMFVPCDQIFIEKSTLAKMIGKFMEDKSIPVALYFDGKIGSPIIFPKSYYESLMLLEGDKGGRKLLGENVIKIEAGVLEGVDIDTMEEREKYDAIFNRGSGSLEFNSFSSLRI